MTRQQRDVVDRRRIGARRPRVADRGLEHRAVPAAVLRRGRREVVVGLGGVAHRGGRRAAAPAVVEPTAPSQNSTNASSARTTTTIPMISRTVMPASTCGQPSRWSYSSTLRAARCVPTLRLTRCSALSTVLRVAAEPVADLLVGVPVEVQRQHARLELADSAVDRQATSDWSSSERDHLVDGVVDARAGDDLVERRLAVGRAGGRRGERDVLVQRRVLVARRGLDRGDDLARDAQLGEVAETTTRGRCGSRGPPCRGRSALPGSDRRCRRRRGSTTTPSGGRSRSSGGRCGRTRSTSPCLASAIRYPSSTLT